jgi:hypothetical protein
LPGFHPNDLGERKKSSRKFRSSENLCRRRSPRCLASRRYLTAAPIRGPAKIKASLPRLANGVDPINVFPIGPDNDNRSRENNYSPLWDAHVSMRTQAAFDAGKVHRIRSMDEQKSLTREGLLTSASINPSGPGNPYVGGLRPTQAIINCPVIAHPDLPPQ